MMFERLRGALISACATVILACVFTPIIAAENGPAPLAATKPAAMPAHLRRSLPGPGHEGLKPLAGKWRVEMSVSTGAGAGEKSVASSDLTCERTWIAGNRYLQDVTQGTFAGSPYYRLGLLGYSNVDELYEWVTVDAANSNMMIYRGERGSGPRMPIEIKGVFTDQGWLGEATAGELVPMRTVITIESKDRHTFELYFTRPDGEEILFDRKVYTRVRQ